jgi:hypothetical protein
MFPTDGIWTEETPVKSVRDVDSEGYHVAMAHPVTVWFPLLYADGHFVKQGCRVLTSSSRRRKEAQMMGSS